MFGSIARGDDHQESDVDFLVDIERGRTLLEVIALERDLQQLLERKVEVLTERSAPALTRVEPRVARTILKAALDVSVPREAAERYLEEYLRSP